MAEYIDREKAIEIIKSGGYWEREDMEVAIACIEQTPAADVVEVVRCKDCKHLGSKISAPRGVYYNCKNYSLPYCKPDDYCSYGIRKDGKDGVDNA